MGKTARSPSEQRKIDQLKVCLERDVQFDTITTGFEKFAFTHQALPEFDFEEIDLSCHFLGKKLNAPFLISPMTGGTELGAKINKNLARAAQFLNIGMAVGSQRVAIENPSLSYSFQVRDVAPGILLMGNLGAVQLNNGFGVQECLLAVEMIEADGLFLHLNPLQEVSQDGGNVNFKKLLPKIQNICRSCPFPVFVKEVGNGISPEAASKMKNTGISGIDISGAGGTSWVEVEKYRKQRKGDRALTEAFGGWGIPTAESLQMVREEIDDLVVVASGGIRTGIDMAKAIALGADLVGVALPLLRPAVESADAVIKVIKQILFEFQTTMFCIGAKNLADLRETPFLKVGL